MSWAEGFYWGQCRLECVSRLPADEGKTVRVTSGTKTWEQVFDDSLSVVFTLPGTNKYTVSLAGNGEEAEESVYTKDILLGYGEYRILEVGYNKTTFRGIQTILDSHKELELLEIGDEVPVTLTDGTEMVYQVGDIDILDDHDVLFVPKWLYPKTSVSMGGSNISYQNSNVDAWITNSYFNLLPEDVREYIVNTDRCFAAIGGNSLVTVERKIFIPIYWEIFGTPGSGITIENSVSRQWPIFTTAENRRKTCGKLGDHAAYYTCSTRPVANLPSYHFCVNSLGQSSSVTDDTSLYPLPCFRLKAQF